MILMTADNIQDQFCFKDTPPKRETQWKSNAQSIDSNVENAASQIHPNELRVYMFVVLACHLAFILHFHLDRNFCM